jgi:tRNA-specific 2-thiouridylase
MSRRLVADNLNWIAGTPPAVPLNCHAKIRYRQDDQPCVVAELDSNQCVVHFRDPQRAVTPGQSVVFYDGQQCLGGGIINTILDDATS